MARKDSGRDAHSPQTPASGPPGRAPRAGQPRSRAKRAPEATPGSPADTLVEPPPAPTSEPEPARTEEQERATTITAPAPRMGRRERQRLPHGNALGILIERQFTEPTSPCRSYADLERRSGISREALSRYVTSRPDRRRSPTIDTLVAVADAMHLSLEAVCRAAAASVRGVTPPREEAQHEREEILSALIGGLSDEQFSALVELLRLLRPVSPGVSR